MKNTFRPLGGIAPHPQRPRRRRRAGPLTAILAAMSVLFPLLLVTAVCDRIDTQMRSEDRAMLAQRLAQYLVQPDAYLAEARPVATRAALDVVHEARPESTGMMQLLASATDQGRSVDCVAAAVYYEARGESPTGQLAVAEVIVNRSFDPAYPASVCAVVYQGAERDTGCQFSFTCDGSTDHPPTGHRAHAARQIAAHYVSGLARGPVTGGATHYHASYMVPYWSYGLHPVRQIDSHVFYRAPSAGDALPPPSLVAATAPSIRAARKPVGTHTSAKRASRAVLVALD